MPEESQDRSTGRLLSGWAKKYSRQDEVRDSCQEKKKDLIWTIVVCRSRRPRGGGWGSGSRFLGLSLGLQGPLKKKPSCVCVCAYTSSGLFVSQIQPKSKPRCAAAAARDGCVKAVGWSSPAAWEKLLMLRRPSSSEGENGNQFVGHVTRVRWDWVAALTIKGDLPSLASPLVRAQAALINLKRVCKDSHRLLWTLLWWTIYFLSFFCWCCHEYLRTWILEHLPKASSDQAVQNGHIFKMYTLVHNNMEAQTLYWLSTFDKGSAQVVAGKLHLQFWVPCLPAD